MASIALVAACLPTLGPLFTDFDLGRLVDTLQHALSLQALRHSSGSNAQTASRKSGATGQSGSGLIHRLKSGSDVELVNAHGQRSKTTVERVNGGNAGVEAPSAQRGGQIFVEREIDVYEQV